MHNKGVSWDFFLVYLILRAYSARAELSTILTFLPQLLRIIEGPLFQPRFQHFVWSDETVLYFHFSVGSDFLWKEMDWCENFFPLLCPLLLSLVNSCFWEASLKPLKKKTALVLSKTIGLSLGLGVVLFHVTIHSGGMSNSVHFYFHI